MFFRRHGPNQVQSHFGIGNFDEGRHRHVFRPETRTVSNPPLQTATAGHGGKCRKVVDKAAVEAYVTEALASIAATRVQ